MIDKLSRNPWLLAGAFVLSALLGAALFAGGQRLAGGEGDTAKMEEVVRNYLLTHPEILPEAMEKLQEKEYAKAIAPNRKAMETPYRGAEWGNPKGDVTVVAFLDYACGYCRASLPALAELVKNDPKVRIVYREFPVLGDNSVLAARWALAAGEQGKFKPFHEALYAGGQISEASINAAAAKAGLDMNLAKQTIGTPRVETEIATNHRLAQSVGGQGTPVWVIGDKVIPGYVEYSVLAEAVKKARARS
ncbi:DsbA family protein [Sphingomonas sp. AOB5]|uniref:DsbA family protein n=1 Tax=Sphingomonas sp. AOB5 TaxID=3034017 RepID=UPI0023F806C6|nr:DsbA family protein [Sphingomonas sp. AOB5]MDF7777698.1 DsbA family protein [Sphingomonas sp. AOB5]